jgi:hypothetical protein
VGVPGVAPGEDAILQTTAGREFPLDFARQEPTSPASEGLGILIGHLHHRVLASPGQIAIGALGMAPVGTGNPVPPAELLDGSAAAHGLEHQRTWGPLAGLQLGELFDR